MQEIHGCSFVSVGKYVLSLPLPGLHASNLCMYRSTFRDHIQVAHSLAGSIFGPAQKLHGATYEVVVEFSAQQLDSHNVVINPNFAESVLRKILDPIRHANLDQVREFSRINTTPEFLAQHVVLECIKHLDNASDGDGANQRQISRVKACLIESTSRRVSYEKYIEVSA